MLKDDRGVALLICLLIVAILTVVVLEFHYEVHVDTALTENSFLSLEAEYVAKSGIALSLAMLRADAENDLALAGGNETDHLGEEWAVGLEQTQVGRGIVAARISDEEGKFNINRVISAEKRAESDPHAVNQLRHLFTELQLPMDPVELTDAVCDWIDSDSVERRAGAEEDYYQSLPIPYRCKNTWFGSIEELRDREQILFFLV